METQKLYRGRLINHVQVVMSDLPRSKRFYVALLEVLGIPLSGEARITSGPTSWSSPESRGKTTGRHLAFQAKDRETVDRFHGGARRRRRDNGAPGERHTIPATTPPSCSIRTATTSRPCSTAPRRSLPSRIEVTF